MRTASRRAPRARVAAIMVTVLTSLVAPLSVATADDLVSARREVTAEPVQDDGSSDDTGDGTAAHEPNRGRTWLLVVIAVGIGGVVGGGLGVTALRNRGGVPVDGENEDGPPG